MHLIRIVIDQVNIQNRYIMKQDRDNFKNENLAVCKTLSNGKILKVGYRFLLYLNSIEKYTLELI